MDDKNKIGMLIALYEKGSMKKTDLYSEIPASNLNSQKLDDLHHRELVSFDVKRFENNTTVVELTYLGRAVAIKLIEARNLLDGLSKPEENLERTGERDKMDCGSPSEEGHTVKG